MTWWFGKALLRQDQEYGVGLAIALEMKIDLPMDLSMRTIFDWKNSRGKAWSFSGSHCKCGLTKVGGWIVKF